MEQATQFKKTNSLIYSQALDLIAREHGFTNYKNYLSVYESHKITKYLSIEDIINGIQAETDITKKMDQAVSMLQNSSLTFHEHLQVIGLFSNSYDDFGIPQPIGEISVLCNKLSLLQNELHFYVLEDYLSDEGKSEVDFHFPWNTVKEIILNNCEGILKAIAQQSQSTSNPQALIISFNTTSGLP